MKRIILGLLATAALAVGLAAPANAGSGSSSITDFYNTGKCYANGVTGNITNYDYVVSGVLKQRYHYALPSITSVLPTSARRSPVAIEFWYGGSRVTRLASSLNDGYATFSGYTKKYNVYMEWKNPSGTIYGCWVTPNPI